MYACFHVPQPNHHCNRNQQALSTCWQPFPEDQQIRQRLDARPELRVEGPVLSLTEGPVLSLAEGPVLSLAEGSRLPVHRTQTGLPARLSERGRSQSGHAQAGSLSRLGRAGSYTARDVAGAGYLGINILGSAC